MVWVGESLGCRLYHGAEVMPAEAGGCLYSLYLSASAAWTVSHLYSDPFLAAMEANLSRHMRALALDRHHHL